MLEKVTRYLTRIKDHSRLDLVRRCFYLKTHEKLSREPGSGSVAWRRTALTEMTRQWGWDTDTLVELDNRRNWKGRAGKSGTPQFAGCVNAELPKPDPIRPTQ